MCNASRIRPQHRRQQPNIYSARICTLMTTCPLEHEMENLGALLIVCRTSRRGVHSRSAASFGADRSLFILKPEPEGCHHCVITPHRRPNTKLISATAPLGPAWERALCNAAVVFYFGQSGLSLLSRSRCDASFPLRRRWRALNPSTARPARAKGAEPKYIFHVIPLVPGSVHIFYG